MSDEAPVVVPPQTVRVWSPLAVGVYSIVFAYPAALILAVKNWRALGQRDRVAIHVVGAILLTIPLVAILYFTERKGRIFSLAANVMAFVYLKEKLRSDLGEFRDAHPEIVVATRPWYSAIGWVLLGLLLFAVLATIIALTAELAATIVTND